jgi:hypothetical protein
MLLILATHEVEITIAIRGLPWQKVCKNSISTGNTRHGGTYLLTLLLKEA